MVEDMLKDLLNEYYVDENKRNELREKYRTPLEKDINSGFLDYKPHFRYGGSLSKYTANKDSCDMDLLCYFKSDCGMNVEEIFNKVKDILNEKKYIFEVKNSAICVTGKDNNYWNLSVDVVPGKYTSNEYNSDVNLWCNKTKRRLRSNPETQVNKVKKSNMKDVIRLIKLYRTKNNFKFKSFFLEIFAIDIIGGEVDQNDDIYKKLIKFCSEFKEIGIKKIYDPANSNNDIMSIHESWEFEIIRNKIKELYEVLLTDNEKVIKDFILGKNVDIDKAYECGAKEHSPLLDLKVFNSYITLSCYDKKSGDIFSNQQLNKNLELKFKVSIPYYYEVKEVKIIISNSGYESRRCLRGDAITIYKSNGEYVREEHTSYNGNHYAQALVKTSNKTIYSKPFIVRVRDF